MPFDSYVFVLFFLPLLVLVWRAVAIVHKPALGPVLLGASILFCFWASPAALLILGLMILVNYGLGLALAAPGEREGSLRRKGLLFLALVLNFTPLLLVRYLPRLGSLFPSLSGVEREIPFWSTLWEGMTASGPENVFVLGTTELAGISFWTLVQAAWLISIYKRHLEPEGLMRHGLFSLAFPYLLAGPIVRYEQMGTQFDNLDAPSLPTLATGLGLFLAGLAKKVLLANWLGAHADTIFAAAAEGYALTSPEALLGVFAFSFQVYFDFSGYIDMALGAALMLGLRLPENFAAPYRATGFIEFWRRWHITLSSFVREYVYQPLAGPAPSFPRVFLGIMAGLLAIGLWHGAALNFLAWVLVHALFLGLNVALRRVRSPGLDAFFSSLVVRGICILVTFVLVSLSWVLFRADSLPHALALYRALFDASSLSLFANGYFSGAISLVPLAIAAICTFALPTAREVFMGCKDGSRPWLSFAPNLSWALVLACGAFACLSVMDMTRPFIF